MKRVSSIVSIVIFIFVNSAFCEDIRISVNDFKVESDNPAYKYLGKGISRLIASEMKRSGKVKLVEREQLIQIQKEQEISVSDLADQQKSIQIGKLLSVRYIVLGEIIDMVSKILTSVRLVDVETGEIVWQGELTEKLETYDYIGASLAQSMLTSLGVNVDKAIVQKVDKKEEKNKEAVINLSDGIDAYDKGDEKAAKKDLETAKTLDPGNETAAYYLAKLVTNTAKFRVIKEPYYNYQNPAFLGIYRTSQVFSSWNGSLIDDRYKTIWDGLTELPNGKLLSEGDVTGTLGCHFPVGDTLGFGIEALVFWTGNNIAGGSGTNFFSERFGLGGGVSAGYKIFDSMSFGIGVSFFNDNNEGIMRNPIGSFTSAFHPAFSVEAGFLYRVPDESFIFDTCIGYSNATIESVTSDTFVATTKKVPLYMENTATFALNEKHTFIIIKQLNDIGLDRTFYNGRLMPAIEHFFVDWFSLRGGIEGSFVRLNKVPDFGLGVIAGFTFRLASVGIDIDLNMTYRRRPSRIVEDTMYRNDLLYNLNFTWNNTSASRN